MAQSFSSEELKAAFGMVDGDGDGFIDGREIGELVRYGVGVGTEEFDRIVGEIDLNLDGRIDF